MLLINESVIFIFPALAFIVLFLVMSIKLKKGIDVFSFCDFTGAKKKNRFRAYKTYTGYNFSISNINKILKKAFRYYKKLLKNGEPLFSFEKEILKHSCKLKQEYKLISKKLNEYSGKEFFEGVPLSLTETIENINCSLEIDSKTSLDYRIARLTILAGCYYISLWFSGKLKNCGFNNYRKFKTGAALMETEKLLLKKFYSLLGLSFNSATENSSYKINGGGRKNHLYTDSANLIADEFGNFAYCKDDKCICEFGKFNFIKHFNFKIKSIFYTDKFCIYENEIKNSIRVCLDVNGNLVIITSFSGRENFFSIKFLSDGLKFIEKTNFLHSCLINEKCGEIIPYRLTGLIYNNAFLDTGINGGCFNRAFKGGLKGFKYGLLFKNIKIATILMSNSDNFEAEKILKFVKLFNKFKYEFYVVVISDCFAGEADECFKKEELSDKKISYLKNYSTLFFDGKKIKIKINFIDKQIKEKYFKQEPFFKIKNTRLKDLAEILYSVPVKLTDSVFTYCLKNILDMSKDSRDYHRQNILELFKMQTLEGLMPDRFKKGFADFKSSNGLLSVFYYLICFIKKYNERDILKETIRYSTFLRSNFMLEESKIFDTLEYHLLAGLQYILNSEDDLKTEMFKVFILKKITPLINDAKIRNNVFSRINALTKKIREKLSAEDKFLISFFDYINLNIKKDSDEKGLSRIIKLFENNSFKNFERAVLELSSIQDEQEKFLSAFLLKQFLTENMLGIKFHKNLVSFNPALPNEQEALKLEINKANLTIGYFGYSGVEIKGRKYYNYNYINLDQDGETVISIN